MSQTATNRRELVAFTRGKTIAGLRFDAEPGTDFDIIFTDGSELEMYAIDDILAWVPMTPADIAAQQERDRQAHEQEAARLATGVPADEEVWVIDGEVVTEGDLLHLAKRAADESQPAVMTAEELLAEVEHRRGESLDIALPRPAEPTDA